MTEDSKKISYEDLEDLRTKAKDVIENVKRKSEKDIVEELKSLKFEVSKETAPDELLKQAEVLKNESEDKKKEASEKFASKPTEKQPDFTDLRKYTQNIDKNSEVLKKVRANETLVHRAK